MVMLTSLDNGVYDLLTVLPSWMIFIIVMSLVLTPIVMEMIRQNKKKKEDQILNAFIVEVGNLSSDNKAFTHSFKEYLNELYSKLDTLLDLLYEKYANNLSPEISNKILELVYDRTCMRTLSFLSEYFSDEKKYSEDGFRFNCLNRDLDSFLRNRYYADVMSLNKMTCKGVTLDIHLSELDVLKVKDDLMAFLEQNKDKKSWELYNATKKYLESYFLTLTSKAQGKLEEKIKEVL